jgi:hypothetical protein
MGEPGFDAKHKRSAPDFAALNPDETSWSGSSIRAAPCMVLPISGGVQGRDIINIESREFRGTPLGVFLEGPYRAVGPYSVQSSAAQVPVVSRY